MLLVPVFALTIEAIYMHTITTDLTGMAAYIGAVSAVLASGGFTKVVSERYERFMPIGHRNHHGMDTITNEESGVDEDEGGGEVEIADEE